MQELKHIIDVRDKKRSVMNYVKEAKVNFSCNNSILCFFVFLINNQYENDIDKIINTALRIQYGWEKKDKLEDICTEKFITSADWENVFLDKKLFAIEKGYMDNIKKISTTEIVIYVNVYTPDIRIHKFTLVKERDGKYRINNIEHDI